MDIGTRIYGYSYGNVYLEDDYVDIPHNELTLRQKIGKKFFGGRYFKPCVKQITQDK